MNIHDEQQKDILAILIAKGVITKGELALIYPNNYETQQDTEERVNLIKRRLHEVDSKD